MATTQQHLATGPHSHHHPARIAIKLTAHAHKKQQKDTDHIQKLVEKTDPGSKLKHHIKPLVTQPADEVAQRVALAAQLDPTYEPVNFDEWYQVEFDPEELRSMPGEGHAATKVLQQHAHKLNDEEDVESAHLIGVPAPLPTVNWQNDPRAANQGYLNAAPVGIDAKYAWTCAGGDGAGTNVVDIERGWDLEHEDLAAAKITKISGDIRFEDPLDISHGTSVLGQILMVDNDIGGVGIAPLAKGRVISSYRSGKVDLFNALMDATKFMQAGDVLLIEAQAWNPMMDSKLWNPDTQVGCMPVEVTDANYDAIRLATALGIVVVEAGANGGFDLDTYVDPAQNQIFNRSGKGFRDSGAIMVGAASSTTRERKSWSSHGSRIDVYAWGENIDTSDNMNIKVHNLYRTEFGGTSGASPIITGAALIIQGIATVVRKAKLTPPQLRKVLTVGGTPSSKPASDRIGVMPNLKAIIESGQIKTVK